MREMHSDKGKRELQVIQWSSISGPLLSAYHIVLWSSPRRPRKCTAFPFTAREKNIYSILPSSQVSLGDLNGG